MSLITLDAARALLLADLPQTGFEEVRLEDALGRTLAEPLFAMHSQPAERRATMDGIAVPDPDPGVGSDWSIIGDVAARGGEALSLAAGECVRIATGAVVPDCAHRVIPEEAIQFSKDRASLESPVGTARFIRRIGADFGEGDRLLEARRTLDAGSIGLAAAANRSAITVMRKPRIAILVAGDELVAPGTSLSPGKSLDSASYALAALIRRWGGEPIVHPLLGDDLDRISSAFATALPGADILLCIGGASVGRRDLMRPAASRLDARFLFERIAVQPGKPCWHARIGSTGLILGLPGNPSSAFVCAHLLLLPLIDGLLGRPPTLAPRCALLATPLAANGEREQYLRATRSYDREGRMLAHALEDQDSGLQAALERAQLLVRRMPDAPALDYGELIDVLELTTA